MINEFTEIELQTLKQFARKLYEQNTACHKDCKCCKFEHFKKWLNTDNRNFHPAFRMQIRKEEKLKEHNTEIGD